MKRDRMRALVIQFTLLAKRMRMPYIWLYDNSVKGKRSTLFHRLGSPGGASQQPTTRFLSVFECIGGL